jgi:hypothetical protein
VSGGEFRCGGLQEAKTVIDLDLPTLGLMANIPSIWPPATGWKRLPMKVRFLVDQISSLKQSFMSIAFVPKAVTR